MTSNQAHIYGAIKTNFHITIDRIIAVSLLILKLHKGTKAVSSFSAEMFPSPTIITWLLQKAVEDCGNNVLTQAFIGKVHLVLDLATDSEAIAI